MRKLTRTEMKRPGGGAASPDPTCIHECMTGGGVSSIIYACLMTHNWDCEYCCRDPMMIL